MAIYEIKIPTQNWGITNMALKEKDVQKHKFHIFARC